MTIISNLPIIILKDSINFDIASKFIVVIPADNPVLETVEDCFKNYINKIIIYNISIQIINTYCC